MFESRQPRSTVGLVFNMGQLIFHSTVRKVRQKHGNALIAILLNLAQSVLFIAAFYLMFAIMGPRAITIRGDFMLYLVTGIFAFLMHVKSVGAVAAAEQSTSPMMQHAPMNTLVSIISGALSALYINATSLIVILALIHTTSQPLDIHYWPGALAMFILAWASGCAVGLVLMALTPWRPELIDIIKQIYIRANMIASGKMFVANMMPSSLIAFFDWNPLFHIIDQARGFTFRNYFPHYSSWEYPVYATILLVMIGLMGEFYTRKHASASWDAAR